MSKVGASAKRWRGIWKRFFKRRVTEGATEVKQYFTVDTGVRCCRCKRPIPKKQWGASKWDGQYICEDCYYREEFVAMRFGVWRNLRPPGPHDTALA